MGFFARELEYWRTGGQGQYGLFGQSRGQREEPESTSDDYDSDDSPAYSDDYETQQRSRKTTRYRGIELRDMGGDAGKVKRAIDRVLDHPQMGKDFQRRIKAVDFAHELRHCDGSSPLGFAGRGDRIGGGVISTRTANTELGLYRNLAHELGHHVRGWDEEDAEGYAQDMGVFEES